MKNLKKIMLDGVVVVLFKKNKNKKNKFIYIFFY